MGDVLLTEVIGAALIGFCIGALLSPPDAPLARGGPGRGGRGTGISLPVFLALVGAAIAVLPRLDLRFLHLGGRAERNALDSYIGWDAPVIKRIPAGGFGEIALRDGIGNIGSVAATADVDIPVGATVRVTGTRDLNVVVTLVAPPPSS